METGKIVYVFAGLVVVLLLVLLAATFFVRIDNQEVVVTNEDIETQRINLIPVTPLDVRTSSVPRGFSFEKTPDGVPPESTLGYRSQSVSSSGELLSVWEQDGLFSRDVYPELPISRTGGDLPLSDGDLLFVPQGVTLRFDYGGEVDWNKTIFDVLAFEVEEGELLREDRSGQLMVLNGASGERGMPDRRKAARVIAPPFEGPESTGREVVRTEMNVPPGVYVISISVSDAEGDARYNFRVVVEER